MKDGGSISQKQKERMMRENKIKETEVRTHAQNN
jgi:hypothetical protein